MNIKNMCKASGLTEDQIKRAVLRTDIGADLDRRMAEQFAEPKKTMKIVPAKSSDGRRNHPIQIMAESMGRGIVDIDNL